jgi:hypothetical protein
MINPIINKLALAKSKGKKLFNVVEEGVDLGAVLKSKLNRSPVAYVIEISRKPSGNTRDMGTPLQHVKTIIGVVIGVSKVNDITGSKALSSVDAVVKEARKQLFGFQPTSEHSALLLDASRTIGANDHALWKLEQFSTEHFEEASQ